MRRIDRLAMVSGFLALLLFPGLAPAQVRQGVGIVSTISGQATVSRVSLPQPQPLQFKDSVFDRDRISTGENSTVKVLMGGKALVTVRELSVLTITEELNRSTVDLQSGKIALGVLQQKMRPGEAIEVRTHNAVAAVRGTVIVVEIVRASAQLPGGPPPALTTNVHVIHGSAVVTPTNIAGASPITVAQFQTYSQIGNILGTIRPLTPTAVNQLMVNLRSSPQFGQGSGTGGATEHIVTQEQSKASTSLPTGGTDTLGQGGAPTTTNVQAPITPPVRLLPPPPPPVKLAPCQTNGCNPRPRG
jgi:FecR-like protein